jgi:TPR repeat protein
LQEGSWDFDRNDGKGFYWLEKAAAQNHEEACINCSWAYRSELPGRLDFLQNGGPKL